MEKSLLILNIRAMFENIIQGNFEGKKLLEQNSSSQKLMRQNRSLTLDFTL